VTASRAEERIRDAPVAVTVIDDAEIGEFPSDNYADLLRRAPGINAVQVSARDVNLTPRAATSRNAKGTLALVDGQSYYQDYFGMVMWDLMPISFDQIAQVEVVRGPGSAVWGANALNGVVNLITKSPAELEGTTVRLAVGELSTGEASFVHAGVGERWSYSLSAGYFTQEGWERPTRLSDGTPLPLYENKGTDQFRGNLRLDFDPGEDRGRWRFDVGGANSDGMMLTGLGPFDAESLEQRSVRTSYEKGGFRALAYVTTHDASYQGVLSADTVGIQNETVHVEGSHQASFGRHLINYGGSVRSSKFDISLVPNEDRRDELGAFVEDEIFLGHRLRLRIGSRFDWVDTYGMTASPRVGLIIEPRPNQTVRLGYNRAYSAPSLVENFLFFPTTTVAPLPTGPFVFPILTEGNEDLDVMSVDAIEVGWTGLFFDQRMTTTVSLYYNRTNDLIFFVPVEYYSRNDPPPGWPLPPAFLELIPLPKTLSYRNLGDQVDRGVELGLDWRISPTVSTWASYSWQDEPEVTPAGDTTFQVNIPPEHRFTLGGRFRAGRAHGSASVDYADKALWTDVPPFVGTTDAYTLVNASVAVDLFDEQLTIGLDGVNLLDEEIQQHIFGDILRRRIVGRVMIRF